MRAVSIDIPDARVFEELLVDAEQGVPLALGVAVSSADGDLLRVIFKIADSLTIPVHGRLITRDGRRRVALVPGDVAQLRKLAAPIESSGNITSRDADLAKTGETAAYTETVELSGGAAEVGAATEVMSFAMAEAAASSGRGRIDVEVANSSAAKSPRTRDLELATLPTPISPPGRDLATAPTLSGGPSDGFTSGSRARDDGSVRQIGALVGRTIGGKYLVEQPIGSGAMGTVFRGRQIRLGTAVAIKVMRAELASDPGFAERFFREAKAATLFDHPGAVRVIDFGEEPDELTYIVTELVEGRDLATVLKEEWPLPDARVVSVILQVLAVLGKAHDAGLVHRDMKPDNVLLAPHVTDDDEKADLVKVCDFGIAKLLEDRGFRGPSSGSLTAQGFIVGTPEYMSPEQAQGDAVDGRSDIYSVGVMLFELLTGELPFEGDTVVKVMLGHITRPPDAPSQRRPSVDPRFDPICLRAMAKNPKDRYGSAREMRRAIRTAFISPEAALGTGSYGELPPPVFRGGGKQVERVELTLPKLEAPRPPTVKSGETKAPKVAPLSRWRGVRPQWALLVLALLGLASLWFLVGSR